MDSLRTAVTALKNTLSWLPDNFVGLLILAIAAGGALWLHGSFGKLLDRTISRRFPFLYALLARAKGVSQLGTLILAFIVAIPVAPFDAETAGLLARFVLIAIIGLVGWTAVTALHMTADLYLSRFKLDEGDNELARKHVTQVRVLSRAADTIIVMFTFAAAMMTFEPVRQYGISLFASAGIAGVVVGLAARPLLSNLFAGVQLAMTQPIRIDDLVTVENETGRVEEITSTYVVLQLWDWRRMVVPLSYFSEKPFINWTREGSSMIGPVFLYLDYSAPIEAIRAKTRALAEASKNWNGKVLEVQVTDAKERSIEVRIIASANSPAKAWDLRCELREQLIDFLQREHVYALPRERMQAQSNGAAERAPARRGAR